MNNLIKLIQNPTAPYRGKPFWSWNGKLDKTELLRQVEVFKDMGFGGFFMHSRTGLKTEYLGDEWFEMIRACSLKAQELGMEAWLYDEDRWPSGTCGGLVSKDRKNRLRFISLYHSDYKAEACEEVSEIIAKYAVKLKTDNNGEERLIDFYPVKSENEVKYGYTYAVFAEEEQKCSDFYNGYTYIDVMNIKVTEEFIKSTHEKYYEKCGDLFGNAIKGIFTDEPYRGSAFNGFSLSNENRLKMTPYTANLFCYYEEKYGKELILPELYWRREGVSYNEVAEQYIDVLDDLFLENFALPCQKWCKDHGIILTGHILHEDSVSIQTAETGSCMRYYEYMDYPGIDNLTQNNRAYWAAKQCSSVARQLGKKYVLSEMYGATGWDMTFEKYKQIGDWQAFFGINLRCHHLSMYTMRGEAKRDYPASILDQNAWAYDWKYIEDYFARLSVLSAEGERICDTLVITPIREPWGKVRTGWMDIFTPNDDSVSKIDQEYMQEFYDLNAVNVDFDYGDEELIGKYGKVVCENGKVRLKIGKVEYGEILCRKDFKMGDKAKKLIEEYRRLGGKFVRSVEELSPTFHVSTPIGVVSTAYKMGDDIWLHLLNLDINGEKSGKIILPNSVKGFNAELWNFRKGEPVGRVDFVDDFRFFAGEEKIIRLTSDKVQTLHDDAFYETLKLPENFKYKLTEYNVLPLDEAVWKFDGKIQNDGKEENVLHIDKKVRIAKGRKTRGGEMIQPWFADKTGEEDLVLGKIELVYEFEVDFIPDTPVYLAKEESKLDCRLNGESVNEKTDIRWVDSCFTLFKITPKKGKNIITVSGDFYEKDGLEAVYVLGWFGVKLPNVITVLPSELEQGDISVQGLPYYSGGIRYYNDINNGNYIISFNALNAALINVYGGDRVETIAYEPYTAKVKLKSELVLETIFSRRNTFGPLHQTYNQEVCAPESFMTEGERYIDFISMPQGLFSE